MTIPGIRRNVSKVTECRHLSSRALFEFLCGEERRSYSVFHFVECLQTAVVYEPSRVQRRTQLKSEVQLLDGKNASRSLQVDADVAYVNHDVSESFTG